jgi:hypothetical protein
MSDSAEPFALDQQEGAPHGVLSVARLPVGCGW